MTTELHAGESGTADPYAETVRIRTLPESIVREPASSEAPACGFDPYNTDIGALAVSPRPRKSLDDMRRLSEAIKLSRLRVRR